MICCVKRLWMVLATVLLLSALSAIADTAPAEFSGAPWAADTIHSQAPANDDGHGSDEASTTHKEAGVPQALTGAVWLFAGLGLMVLAGVNSRKRRRQPQSHDMTRNQNNHDQISTGRKGP